MLDHSENSQPQEVDIIVSVIQFSAVIEYATVLLNKRASAHYFARPSWFESTRDNVRRKLSSDKHTAPFSATHMYCLQLQLTLSDSDNPRWDYNSFITEQSEIVDNNLLI